MNERDQISAVWGYNVVKGLIVGVHKEGELRIQGDQKVTSGFFAPQGKKCLFVANITALAPKWTIVKYNDPGEDIKKRLDIVCIGVAYGNGVVNENTSEGGRFVDCLCSHYSGLRKGRLELTEDIH